MWTFATQSALVVIIISAATTIALLLRSRTYLYIRYGLFSISIGLFYLTKLLITVFPHYAILQSLRMMAGGGVIILASAFLDALLGNAGVIERRQQEKTLIIGVVIVIIGATPLASQSWVQTLALFTGIMLLTARVNKVGQKSKKVESPADQARLRYFAYVGLLALMSFCCDIAHSFHLPIPPLGGVAIAVYLYFIYHALLVSRLLDLHELLGKALVFTTLGVILATVYGIMVIWAGSKSSLLLFNTFIASSLILILYEPIKSFLEEKTTRFFFKEHVTFANDIRDAAKKLANIIELGQACDFVLESIYDSKRATHASIYLLNPSKTGFNMQAYRGQQPPSSLDGKEYPVFFRYLMEKSTPILREGVLHTSSRLQQHPHDDWLDFSQKYSKTETTALLTCLQILHSELIIPLRHTSGIVGFMSLQDERLTDAYTQNEIAALTSLGAQLAITIENSLLFSQVKERDRLASLGEMSAGLAHEIRNPLAAIKGAAQILDPTRISPEEQELVHIIIEEVNRLNKVVTEFLNYSRPLKGVSVPTQLNEVILRTLHLMEHDLPKDIHVDIHLEKNLPIINADPEQLRQVLINLILNAKDAMEPQKGGTIKIQTRFVKSPSHLHNLPHKSGYVEWTVQDTGKGFSEDLLNKIFIPFFTTKTNGNGLGLSLCQRIIQHHGGSIQVHSEPEIGTTFLTQIPLSRAINLQDEQARISL